MSMEHTPQETETLGNIEPIEDTPEIDITEHVGLVNTLDELYRLLQSVPQIKTSKQTLTGEELIAVIEAVRRKEVLLETITKKYGLRDKVYEILGDNVLSQELKERKITKQVAKAQTLEELKAICGSIDYIEGTHGTIPGEQLVEIIEGIESGTMPPEALTRTCGLRDKVYQIIGEDKVSEEIEEDKQEEQEVKEEVSVQEEIPVIAEEATIEEPTVLKEESVMEEKTPEKAPVSEEKIPEEEKSPQEQALERIKDEYDDLYARYEDVYIEYKDTLKKQPTGWKKFFSGFKDRKRLQELEERVLLLKNKCEVKEIEYFNAMNSNAIRSRK